MYIYYNLENNINSKLKFLNLIINLVGMKLEQGFSTIKSSSDSSANIYSK